MKNHLVSTHIRKGIQVVRDKRVMRETRLQGTCVSMQLKQDKNCV